MPDDVMLACVEECKEHTRLGHDATWGMNFVACATCGTHVTVYRDGLGEIVYDDQMYNFKNKRSTIYKLKPKNYIALQSSNRFTVFIHMDNLFININYAFHMTINKLVAEHSGNLHILVQHKGCLDFIVEHYVKRASVWVRFIPTEPHKYDSDTEVLGRTIAKENVDLIIVFMSDITEKISNVPKIILLEALRRDTLCLLVDSEYNMVYLDTSVETANNIISEFRLDQ